MLKPVFIIVKCEVYVFKSQAKFPRVGHRCSLTGTEYSRLDFSTHELSFEGSKTSVDDIA